MAPPKKSKKLKKDSKKMKKKKKLRRSNSVPREPKAVDSEWWDCFWHKNSSTPGCSVPIDEEEGFKHFFRVSKKTFDYICSLVREDLVSRPPSGLINIEGRLLSVEKQVAIALRRLASGESQVSVGAAFGVGQSTVSQVTWRFIESLEDRARHHLRWPNGTRMEAIKSQLETRYGLPNCCGAIEATHIIMTLPAVQTSDDWCDPNLNYSMLLQGVVDHDMRFLDIVTGWPGGMTVSRLLKCSGLFKLCNEGERMNGNPRGLIREYIVGGVSYPLLPWLVTPFEENVDFKFEGHVSGFNAAHEAARQLAVKAFSQLKGSWRILNKVMWRPDKRKLPSIILVCCLLHNIAIDNGDRLNPDVPLSGHHDSGYVELSCKQVDPLGRVLREDLAKAFKRNEQSKQNELSG